LTPTILGLGAVGKSSGLKFVNEIFDQELI